MNVGASVIGFCETHPDEALSQAVYELGEPEGVSLHRAHPEAAALGVRFVGKAGQLMRHYRGMDLAEYDLDDPEDAAAYANMQWLGARANNEQVLIYDMHNTPIPGVEYFEVGRKALKATMAGAFLLGHTNYLVSDGRFYSSVQNAGALETGAWSDEDIAVAAKKLHAGLGAIAAKGAGELDALYDKIVHKLTFYECREILIANPEDTSKFNEEVSSILKELEDIPSELPFSSLSLPAAVTRTLKLRGDTYFGYWGYKNQSFILPEFGCAADGTPRRMAFGSILEKVDPPTVQGRWAYFPSAITCPTSSRQRRPQAIPQQIDGPTS